VRCRLTRRRGGACACACGRPAPDSPPLRLRRLGELQYASLEDLGDKPAVISLVVKQGAARVRMEATVSHNWRQVLDGSAYKAALVAASHPWPGGVKAPLDAPAVPREHGKTAGWAAHGGEGQVRAKASKQGAKAGLSACCRGKQGRVAEAGGAAPGPAAAAGGGSIVQEHQRIQWIGEAHDEPPSKSGPGGTPPHKGTGGRSGRRYYSKVLLANGSEVRIGSAVILQAPEGEEPFLAQVEQLWENEADKFKMMRCKWYYRAAEVAARFPRAIAAVPGLPADALHKEIMCSDDVDDNYLTTIERPCCVMHLEAVPPDIRGCWLKGPDNFFYRSKYARRNKQPLTSLPCPQPKLAADASASKSSGKSGAARPPAEAPRAAGKRPDGEHMSPPRASLFARAKAEPWVASTMPTDSAAAAAAAAAAAPEHARAAGSKRRLPEGEAECRADQEEEREAESAKRPCKGHARGGGGGSERSDAEDPGATQAKLAIACAGGKGGERVEDRVQAGGRLPPPAGWQPCVGAAVAECLAGVVTSVCVSLDSAH
jgi:hypothetical protein